MALTSSTKASKLFTRAWLSSPSAHFPGKTLTESERLNIEFAKSFPECDEKSCWKRQDSKTLLDKVPKSWASSALSTTLPGADEDKSKIHEFLVLDGRILKKTPQDSWKLEPKLAANLVIGTTAHAAFDPANPSPAFSSNLTAEDIRRLVNDSVIGQSGLTDEALELYGETVQGLISMISDIRYVCPLLVLARSQDQNLPFYVATQTKGDLKVADVDSDVQAILGRYESKTPEKRRYLDSIRQLFYYFVGHGKVNHYRSQNFILNIEQDVIPQSELPNCNFWIKNDIVPRYATIY
jgi:carboxylesterase type B